jgi:Winged helix-turn helix
MIHRISPDTRVSWRTRHAQESLCRDSCGGASPDAGGAAARAVRLSARPPYHVVVCRRTHPDGYRRHVVLLALQRVPHYACLSEGHPRLGARRAGTPCAPSRTTGLLPPLRRSLLALLKAPPRADGWCRTRWSCATLAATLQAKRGIVPSAETMRRWLHELGWVWKRAKLAAKDDDPQRVNRLARIRCGFAQLKRCEAMVCADEVAIHWLPNVGCAWRPKGTQGTVMTPGQNPQHFLAGALEPTTGTLHHGVGPRKTNALFRDLLGRLEGHYPAERYTRLSVVVENSNMILG